MPILPPSLPISLLRPSLTLWVIKARWCISQTSNHNPYYLIFMLHKRKRKNAKAPWPSQPEEMENHSSLLGKRGDYCSAVGQSCSPGGVRNKPLRQELCDLPSPVTVTGIPQIKCLPWRCSSIISFVAGASLIFLLWHKGLNGEYFMSPS